MVYMMRAGALGLMKIGHVSGGRDQVERRRRELQCGTPYDLHVVACAPGGAEIERLMHEHFADRHVRGEWFDLADLDTPGEGNGIDDVVLMCWIHHAMLATVGMMVVGDGE